MSEEIFKTIDKELEESINDCLAGREPLNTKFGIVRINNYGYYFITSRKEGNKGKALHRLIWEKYYGKPVPEGYDIHHINGDKLDNRIQNLQCVEHSKHISFHNKGRRRFGENNSNSKYTHWDNSYVRYIKGAMFLNNEGSNPRKCFEYKYNGYRLPIGGFYDFISVEIINDLVNDAIGE